MFVDGKSIRHRVRDPDAPSTTTFEEGFREKWTRPLSREAVTGAVTSYAADRWARQATVSAEAIRRRLERGAAIPIRPDEIPDTDEMGRAVQRARFVIQVCYYCGAPSSVREIQTDHAIPKSRGGTDHNRNLLAACRSCNSRKYDATYEGFRAKMAAEYSTAPPTFFGETDEGQRLVWFTFDPDDLPEKLHGRPIRDPDRDRMETNTSRHLGL